MNSGMWHAASCSRFASMAIVVFLALSAGASARAASKTIEFDTYGGQTDIKTVAVTFDKWVNTPMPHWAPVLDKQREPLPHDHSQEVTLGSGYYRHWYEDNFSGLVSGTQYRVTYEVYVPPPQGEEEGSWDLQERETLFTAN